MYVAVVITILGQGLALGNVTVLGYGALVWLLFHVSGPEMPLHVIPRNQLDGSTVDLLKTAENFLPPQPFGVVVDLGVQAFK